MSSQIVLNEKKATLSESYHRQLLQLITLKLALGWLEKQDWLKTLYISENPIHEFLFQTQLTTKCIWDNIFQKNNKNKFDYNTTHLNEKIDEMCKIDSQLDTYLKLKLSNES